MSSAPFKVRFGAVVVIGSVSANVILAVDAATRIIAAKRQTPLQVLMMMMIHFITYIIHTERFN